jgi:hypothetical protein
MITAYDYILIGFYLVFMLAIGVVFRRMSKNTSDYFRAGGAMPWWITGTSAWIFSFNAWTFTGAADIRVLRRNNFCDRRTPPGPLQTPGTMAAANRDRNP